jgi:hypothetical protein
MRLSLMKAAHANARMGQRTGNSGISLVFREMWGAAVGRLSQDHELAG